MSPEVWIVYRLGGCSQRVADSFRKGFTDYCLRGDRKVRYHFDDQRACRITGRGGSVQQDVSHQPQLVFPDRGVDQKHESVVIHVGQSALSGQGGGQILAQQLIEPTQSLGALDQRTKSRRRGRLQGLRG